jgi:hypothetical protein
VYQSLIATSKTLQQLLDAEIKADPVLYGPLAPYRVRGMQVRLITPHEMSEGDHEGLSVWLYRVLRDDQRLNDPPRRPTPFEIEPVPLPLRLHYLVTPITSRANEGDPETEQYLLGKVLQIFHTHPRLRGADLKEELAGSQSELCVRLESMTLDEITRVWEALEGSYQLSVSYEVSLVEIASARQPPGVTPVTVVVPEVGVSVA